MEKPRYEVGDTVYYFDSFTGNIVEADIQSLISEKYEVKTQYGDVISTDHVAVGYELTTGVQIKEHLLFNDPLELIQRYCILFDDMRKQITLGRIH